MRGRLDDREWARVATPIIGNFLALLSEFCLHPDTRDFSPELLRRYRAAGEARDPEELSRACRAIARHAYERMLTNERKEEAA